MKSIITLLVMLLISPLVISQTNSQKSKMKKAITSEMSGFSKCSVKYIEWEFTEFSTLKSVYDHKIAAVRVSCSEFSILVPDSAMSKFNQGCNTRIQRYNDSISIKGNDLCHVYYVEVTYSADLGRWLGGRNIHYRSYYITLKDNRIVDCDIAKY